MSSICGGIISESEFNIRLKQHKIEGVMMAFILPDKHYKKYWELKDKGKDERAGKLFNKHSWSII